MNTEKIVSKIEKYKDLDLSEINPDDIPDIKEIKIDKRKSSKDRILDFLNSVENPYVFKINGKLVQIKFSDTNKTAEDCLTNVLKNLYR